MVCPYCQVEYTAEQPCFCHPVVNTAHEERESAAPLYAAPQETSVCSNSTRGNRID
jgi:hypothetical protein